MSDKRYIAYNSECLLTLEDAQQVARELGGKVKVYDASEMAAPNYRLLVEWIASDVRLHRSHCATFSQRPISRTSGECSCDLAPALKAAWIE